MSKDFPVRSLKSMEPVPAVEFGVAAPENGSLNKKRERVFPTDLRFRKLSKPDAPACC